MTRDLVETLRRFDAAANVHVVAHWVSWPEYENFVASLRSLAEEARQLLLTGELLADYNKLWRIRRILHTSIVDPAPVIAEQNLSRASTGGEYGARLTKVLEDLEPLSQSENPMVKEIRRYLAGEQKQRISPPAVIHVLVNNDTARFDKLPSLSDDPRYEVRLTTVSQARKSPVGDVMFVIGSPEDHESSFKSWDDRTRAASWILNSPSAVRVICLLRQDSRDFDANRYEVWEGAGQFDAITHGERTRIDLGAIGYMAPKFTEPHPPATQLGEVVVSAFRFRLADGRVVYFSDEGGPKPWVMKRDDFEVGVEDARAKTIVRGNLLLINSVEASRVFIASESTRLLTEKHSLPEIDEFREVVSRYKAALREISDVGAFVQDAVRRGVSEPTVRGQIQRAHFPEAIATKRMQDFIVLNHLLGFDVGEKEWSAVSRLQTANRQAGKAAKERLRNAIADDDSIYERLIEPSLVEFNDDELGAIIASAVVEDPVPVPKVSINNLGVVKR